MSQALADKKLGAETAKEGILLSFSIYPAFGSLLVALVMRWYILTNEKIAVISRDLARADSENLIS
jgi:GPH family glycoside/pentoside/hexuronide:cation symporter